MGIISIYALGSFFKTPPPLTGATRILYRSKFKCVHLVTGVNVGNSCFYTVKSNVLMRYMLHYLDYASKVVYYYFTSKTPRL